MRDSFQPPTERAPLPELAIVFPILPGMAVHVERLAAELSGPKYSEYCESQRKLGIRKERWFLNRTPQGDSVTVYVEAEDVVRALGKLVASKDPTDLWLKEEVRRVTGVDFSGPSLALPTVLLRYPA
ncbi:MAG: hypothetical protein ABSB97_00730 [Thermoplasmata archaeon]|jgi:hypothetical protein